MTRSLGMTSALLITVGFCKMIVNTFIILILRAQEERRGCHSVHRSTGCTNMIQAQCLRAVYPQQRPLGF